MTDWDILLAFKTGAIFLLVMFLDTQAIVRGERFVPPDRYMLYYLLGGTNQHVPLTQGQYMKNVPGLNVPLQSKDDCDRTFDLSENKEVTLDYWDGVNGDCEIMFTGSSDSDFPRICVKPIDLEFGGCTVEVDVHHLTVVEGYENQKYACSTSNEESCTYLDKATVIFKSVSHKPQVHLIDIKLRVYAEKSEFQTDGGGTWSIIIISAISSMIILVATVACIIIIRYRRRSLLAGATEYRQPQQQFSPYPIVQYQAANQSVGGYQRSGTGYPPTEPVSGYPLQPQGYSVQPHAGYQPVDQETYQLPSNVDQSTARAPRTGNFSDPPPSYEKALELA